MKMLYSPLQVAAIQPKMACSKTQSGLQAANLVCKE